MVKQRLDDTWTRKGGNYSSRDFPSSSKRIAFKIYLTRLAFNGLRFFPSFLLLSCWLRLALLLAFFCRLRRYTSIARRGIFTRYRTTLLPLPGLLVCPRYFLSENFRAWRICLSISRQIIFAVLKEVLFCLCPIPEFCLWRLRPVSHLSLPSFCWTFFVCYKPNSLFLLYFFILSVWSSSFLSSMISASITIFNFSFILISYPNRSRFAKWTSQLGRAFIDTTCSLFPFYSKSTNRRNRGYFVDSQGLKIDCFE